MSRPQGILASNPAPKPTSAKPGAKKAGPAAAPKAAPPVQWYEVLETHNSVPRQGGTYRLAAGKQIKSGEYDVESLRRAGVKLRACDPPSWWVEQQHNAAAALAHREDENPAQQLADRGVPGLVQAAQPVPETPPAA